MWGVSSSTPVLSPPVSAPVLWTCRLQHSPELENPALSAEQLSRLTQDMDTGRVRQEDGRVLVPVLPLLCRLKRVASSFVCLPYW